MQRDWATKRGLDFFSDHGAIGILADTDGPRMPGRYDYMPYRSLCHLEMHRRLQAGDSPRCRCRTEIERVEFTVRSCPEYGVLEIGEIERTPLDVA